MSNKSCLRLREKPGGRKLLKLHAKFKVENFNRITPCFEFGILSNVSDTRG